MFCHQLVGFKPQFCHLLASGLDQVSKATSLRLLTYKAGGAIAGRVKIRWGAPTKLWAHDKCWLPGRRAPHCSSSSSSKIYHYYYSSFTPVCTTSRGPRGLCLSPSIPFASPQLMTYLLRWPQCPFSHGDRLSYTVPSGPCSRTWALFTSKAENCSGADFLHSCPQARTSPRRSWAAAQLASSPPSPLHFMNFSKGQNMDLLSSSSSFTHAPTTPGEHSGSCYRASRNAISRIVKNSNSRNLYLKQIIPTDGTSSIYYPPSCLGLFKHCISSRPAWELFDSTSLTNYILIKRTRCGLEVAALHMDVNYWALVLPRKHKGLFWLNAEV